MKLGEPDWGDHSHSLALCADLRGDDELLVYLILNAYWEALDFELPPAGGGSGWRRFIDTSLASPADVVPWESAPAVSTPRYRAGARSVVVLFSGAAGPEGGV